MYFFSLPFHISTIFDVALWGSDTSVPVGKSSFVRVYAINLRQGWTKADLWWPIQTRAIRADLVQASHDKYFSSSLFSSWSERIRLIKRENRRTMTTNTRESFSLMANGRFASEIVWQLLSFSNKDVRWIVFNGLALDKVVYSACRLHYLTIFWLIIVSEGAE